MATRFPLINQVLPIEMLKKILEKLDFRSLCLAKHTCRHWKGIINGFKLKEIASSEYLNICTFCKKRVPYNHIFPILGRITCTIVVGGYNREYDANAADILTGDFKSIQLPKLPTNIIGLSMAMQNGSILLCGGNRNEKKCLKLEDRTWTLHSILNKKRIYHSTVTTQKATFLFGGEESRTTFEYLPKDSSKWLMGKTRIPGGFESGSAIALKSEQEILLFGCQGGNFGRKRILKFNVNDHTFQELPSQLRIGRQGHRCAYIPNSNKIMITGGYSYGYLDSAEILDTEDGSVTKASPMNTKRHTHGMDIVSINGEDRLAVYGGNRSWHTSLDCVEVYNTTTGKWEYTDIKLKITNAFFGYLNVKLEDIITKL